MMCLILGFLLGIIFVPSFLFIDNKIKEKRINKYINIVLNDEDVDDDIKQLMAKVKDKLDRAKNELKK